jgi:adenine-specific DNA-methyltransferase
LGMLTRDISLSIDKRKKVSDAIDSIKVLDPAVGSGHFLVSVLNELIAIKASLRVLFDTDGKLLNDISCTVANDELIIQDIYGNNYSYDANQPASLRIQKALFEQKKNIIENCLYGVDLNPNSVNICRLRLWIELLKNAYYSENEDGQRNLTTLPNIDINIKVGDSLIHRFALDDKFDLRTKNFKDYITLVRKYKNTSNKSVKSEINQKINRIKDTFVNSFKSPEAEALDKAMAELTAASGTDLFGNGFDPKRYAELKKKADEAKEAFENRKGDPFYNSSLEWRIEFPEVLDNNGNFVGFDIVIANPPYIFSRNHSFDEKTKQYYLSHYEVDEYQANTYTLFMELGYRLLKKNGTFAYIVPNNMLTLQNNQKIRNFLLHKSGRLVVINSLDKIFADASVDNCIIFLQKEKSDEITVGELEKGDFSTVGTVNKSFFGKHNPIISISMVKYKYAVDIFWKLNEITTHLSDFAKVKIGVKEYEVGKGKPQQVKADKDNDVFYSDIKKDDSYRRSLTGKDVDRYSLTWAGKYIKYGDNLAAKRDPNLFVQPRLLVRQIPTASNYAIKAAYTDEDYISNQSLMIVTEPKDFLLPALLGIINSKAMTIWFNMRFDKFQRRTFPRFLVSEFEEFPIPQVNKNLQDKIAKQVKTIQEKTKAGENYSKENKEVDELVMNALKLTEEEKESVRKFEF